jgi:hypothetical protein
MSRQTAILLAGAVVGVGLLGMSSATAAPANGAAIGAAASAEELTQKVVWRGHVGGRGYVGRAHVVGHRYGRRGYGVRPGWRVGAGLAAAGVATAAGYGAYNYGYGNNYGYGDYASDTSGYGYGYRPGWRYGYGWRPGARLAAAAQNYNYGYGANYGNYGYAANAGSYGYRNNYGSGYYGQKGVAAAVASRPYNYGYGTGGVYASDYGSAVAPIHRYSRAFCINAVRERFGMSATDAGKPTNEWAVIRCLEGGPLHIG